MQQKHEKARKDFLDYVREAFGIRSFETDSRGWLVLDTSPKTRAEARAHFWWQLIRFGRRRRTDLVALRVLVFGTLKAAKDADD